MKNTSRFNLVTGVNTMSYKIYSKLVSEDCHHTRVFYSVCLCRVYIWYEYYGRGITIIPVMKYHFTVPVCYQVC